MVASKATADGVVAGGAGTSDFRVVDDERTTGAVAVDRTRARRGVSRAVAATRVADMAAIATMVTMMLRGVAREARHFATGKCCRCSSRERNAKSSGRPPS